MIRIRPDCIRAYVAMSVFAVVLVMAGCGNSSDTSSSAAPNASSPAKRATAAMPVAVPVIFEQLSLQSKVSKKADSNGLMFYVFSYADRDGKLHKCELPAAMAQGQRTPDAWLRVFDTYRLEETVVKRKATKDANKDNMSDFPFVAPRPPAAPSPQPVVPTGPVPSGPTGPPMPRGP